MRAPPSTTVVLLGLLVGGPAAQAGEIAGRVLDGDGQPLAGASVYAYDLRLGYVRASAGADGSYAVLGVEPGLVRLRAVPAASQDNVSRNWPDAWAFCDAALIEVEEDAALSGHDFALGPGASIRGTLVDEDGAPVAGALVTARGAQEDVEGLARQAVSGGDGRFALLGLDTPRDEGSLWTCDVEVDGWPDQLFAGAYDVDEADLVEVTAQGEVDLGTWALTPGVGATGLVLGPDGPVAGASVFVYASSQVVDALTDAEGRYEAWGVPPGDLLAWASAPGFGVTYWPDADRPEGFLAVDEEGMLAADVDLFLPAEATLSGRLVGGNDLSGVSVLLYNDTHTVGRGTPVEADGTFLLDRLHGGDYELFVYAADEGSVDDWVHGADGEPQVFALAPETDHDAGDIALPLGASVSGTIRGEDGAPIYGAYVYATAIGGDQVEVVSSARDGSYAIPGLPAGRWQLSARYVHYCDADPGWVEVWWDGEVYEPRGHGVDVATGQVLEGYDFALPLDDDHDAMGDAWEQEHGLDPGRDDSAEDPDGDGYSNLDEYLLGTDPRVAWGADERLCGCGDRGMAQAWIPLAGLPIVLGRRRRASPA